jgi:hypothetical protein
MHLQACKTKDSRGLLALGSEITPSAIKPRFDTLLLKFKISRSRFLPKEDAIPQWSSCIRFGL